ncbi:hypothetical protein ACT17_05985 [Mycolicibacterium conceptionense]|uniref:Type I-E CRISPR-associated protein Cse2/CasB n=1 Tax=Mycolicibacterium conceptionense TaxID=451644 RepID=A0A0J8UDI9_9MYCO|nr:type I-E CRISPR-associated protein Cse2/CasB [Mycolicibacterium conceptionense]KMV19598.1 hypothetical protein ACT17_05985 [Mycolicibacterium conceptionense]
MTTTNTDAQERNSDGANPEGPQTPEEFFFRRLYGAHRSRHTGALQHWTPGSFTVEMFAVTGNATDAQFNAWALTAKLFAIFNSTRTDPERGYRDTGIGSWARNVARSRSVSGDPGTERRVRSLVRASSIAELDRVLTPMARTRGISSPDWSTVLAELTAWLDPHQRDRVRFDWARDFTAFRRNEKSTASAEAVEAPATPVQ